jgi:hypothetical protein
MSEDLARLLAMVPPPSAPPDGRHYDWSGVTRVLQTEIPPDFRELVAAYGCGMFDQLLWIHEPDCPNPNLDFVRNALERQEALDYLWGAQVPEPIPEWVNPEEDRLIAWGGTDYGSYYWWHSSPGVPPEKWPVMVDEGRGPTWYEYPMTATQWLYGVLSGQVDVPFFRRSLPLLEHTFEPL